MNKKIFSLCIVTIALLSVIFIKKYNTTQQQAIDLSDEYYAVNESVPIGENFFWNSSENPNGYSVRIISSDVVRTEDIIETITNEQLLSTDSYDLTTSKYTYTINITIKNESNSNGSIIFSNYMMMCGSLTLSLNSSLTSILTPELSGASSFTLPVGKERSFIFAFTPDYAEILCNDELVYEKMQNNNFVLCVSQVPSRKMIWVK